MIADLKPYAEYKDSGLPWLGRVPAHWGSRRMKFLFQERSEKGFPREPLLAATQSKGVVRKDDYGLRTVTAMNGLENLKLVNIGDFVISLRSFQGGIEVSHARGIISPAYTVLRPRSGFEPRFFRAYFKSADFVRSLTLFVTGIREGQNVDYERLSRAYMPLPPSEEQAAIVRFLDWATGQLDRAIRAKRKVIALLNEQKQAIIHRAVTRGLDPSVPMKDSGIPWLGEVPAHWEVRRLRASVTDCINGLWGSDPDGKSDITCVRVADFDRENLRVTLKQKTTRAIPESARSRRLLRRGDLLLEKSGGGDKQPVGAVVMYEQDELAVCSNFVARLPIARGYCPSFVNYLHCALYARRINVSSVKQTTGIQNLDGKSYLSEPVAFPPTLEQQAIADFLNIERDRFASVILHRTREIDLLREYRTRLIADLVTGKLDVRNAAARLTDASVIEPSEGDAELDDEPETEEAAV